MAYTRKPQHEPSFWYDPDWFSRAVAPPPGPRTAMRIDGTDDPETIEGSETDDKIFGRGGDDVLRGNGGDDVLIGGDGADRLDGGDGFDTASFRHEAGAVSLFIEAEGTSVAYVDGVAQDRVKGVEKIIGSAGDDRLGSDMAGARIRGGAGDDIVFYTDANSRFDDPGRMRVNGGDGDHDAIDFSRLTTGVGVFDLDVFGKGLEDVNGSAAGDYLAGNARSNTIHGAGGNDYLQSAAPAGQTAVPDFLYGDDGGDFLRWALDGAVAGAAIGGDGDDWVYFDPDRQFSVSMDIDGGAGTDTVSFNEFRAGDEPLAIDLRGQAGGAGEIVFTDGRITLHGIENAGGSKGDDSIIGDANANVLWGGDGSDRVSGGDGDDVLYGNREDVLLYDNDPPVLLPVGTDRFVDVLTGGAGADRFTFEALSPGAGDVTDRIADFSRAEGDGIDLRLIDAVAASTQTDEAFTFIGKAAFTHHAGELRYTVVDGDALVMADVTGDGQADFAVLVEGAHILAAGDFDL